MSPIVSRSMKRSPGTITIRSIESSASSTRTITGTA